MFKGVIEHGLVAVNHLPTARSAAPDHRHHLAPVKTGFWAKRSPSDKPEQAQRCDLVDHLSQLAGTAVPKALARLVQFSINGSACA